MKMLDTNICIYTIKHKPESVKKRFTAEIPNGLCISSITLAELWYGVEKSSNPKKRYYPCKISDSSDNIAF